MKIKKTTFLLTIFFLLSYALLAQKPEVKAVFVETPPKIDGKLDEAIWETASQINSFEQREPREGEPATEKTEVYVCYGKKHIYFGFKCYDTNEITAKELARDVSLSEDDRVQIILDTFLDHRNAFWFQIGPLGSIGDALISENGAAFNKQWDGLWEGRSRIHEEGWDAEIAIPFNTLNFREDQTTWGLKVIRQVKRKLESNYWPEGNLDTYNFQVSDAGLLTGLEGMSQGIGLDINPYGLVGVDQHQGEDTKYVADAGLDVFYQLTSGLTAALTINTDFAQTEVDNRQVNLTRFNLFFPEKREFFLDGANYFNFGINGDRDNFYNKRMVPFFSRRLGLDEDGNPVPIIVGGKLTGQAGNWNIGVMDILDDRPSGKQNFFVSRINRNIGKQSTVGMIATHGNSLGSEENYVIGADTKLATSTFLGNKNLVFTGYGLKSQTDSLSGSDESFGAEINLPNDFIAFRAGFMQIGENFKAGIGFVPRPGIRMSYLNLFVGPRPKKWGIMQYTFGGWYEYITNLQNELLTEEIGLIPGMIRFNSGEELRMFNFWKYEKLVEDFNVHDDIIIPKGEYEFWTNELKFSTAQRRNLWAEVGYSWGGFFNGDIRNVSFAFGYKIFTPIFLGMEYEWNDVKLPNGEFDTQVFRMNFNIFFSPTITLSNFIQYDNLSSQMGGQSRFRWIIKPGKEVLLVWNSKVNDMPLEEDRLQMEESSIRLKFKYNFRF